MKNQNQKIDWKKKAEEMKEKYDQVQLKNKDLVKEKQGRKLIRLRPPGGDEKICPFMSTPTNLVACNSRCMLYRQGKAKTYECPFIELTSISWTMRGKYTSTQKHKDYNYKKK